MNVHDATGRYQGATIEILTRTGDALSMRTTIKLDDSLLAEARAHAARTGTSLTAVVENALREALARRRGEDGGRSVDLPVFRSSRPLPGVDLDASAALLELMEGTGR